MNIVMTRHSIDTMIPIYVMTSTPVVSGPGSASLGSTSYKIVIIINMVFVLANVLLTNR